MLGEEFRERMAETPLQASIRTTARAILEDHGLKNRVLEESEGGRTCSGKLGRPSDKSLVEFRKVYQAAELEGQSHQRFRAFPVLIGEMQVAHDLKRNRDLRG